jgi:chromate reductase
MRVLMGHGVLGPPMSVPKILVFAGSIRTGSFNARLAALAAKELALAGADVTRISLEDYPLPIYDGDDEAESGVPDNAKKLKSMMAAHQGVFIASPEYNASVTPLLKNTIDWISRVRERGEPPLPEQITVFHGSEAFDEMDNLKDERAAATLKRVALRLTDAAREMSWRERA